MGQAHFPDDDGTPSIQIDIDCPIRHAVEVLGHELAHVAAPHDENHGPDWEAAFAAIHEEYCALVGRGEDTSLNETGENT